MAQNNSNLYLLRYNNYYNRIVKTEPTLDDYLQYQEYGPLSCNFNPADGIDTDHIFNLPYLANSPEADYLIVQNAETQEIVSRWFIVNAERMRGGQYRLSLHRDLVADFYEAIVSAPAFVERATLGNTDNPFIFNNEGIPYNQIKKKEHLLKDESGTGWLVGYTAESFTENTIVSIAESGQAYPNSPIDYNTLSSWANSDAVTITDYWTIGYKGFVQGYAGVGKYWSIGCGKTTGTAYEMNRPVDFSSQILFYTASGQTVSSTGTILQNAIRDKADEIKSAMEAYIDTKAEYARVTETQYNTLLSMNGGTFISGGNLFSITVTNSTVESKLYENIGADTGALYTIPYNILQQSGTAENYGAGNVSGINAYIPLSHLDITITTQSVPATSVTISNSARILDDAPYRMFAIPLDPVMMDVPDAWYLETKDRQFTSRLATEIAKSLGTNLYDLQLLPYCPKRSVLDITNKTNKITLLGTEGKDYDLVRNSGGTPLTFLVWCDKSSFSVNIDYNIEVPANAVDFKIMNETEFVRLSAPNYSASYEFKATMNRGVTGFEANCTYKPFQPYIEVNPKYNSHTVGSLYGGDFNDQRGLVCSGDFSIALINDAWVQYEINNKSYADAFDRQVANMTNTYAIQREQQRIAGNINAWTAGISGATTGAMAGSLVPGVGTAVGVGAGLVAGVGAGLLSSYGANKDLEFADALQKEAMSYTKDMYAYNLQNIQALPYTLGRVSAYSINNKIFPFLEFYGATDKEVEALRNKIIYHGMTIGAIDTISNYIQTDTKSFISAQVIRLDDIGEDYHCASAIANEIHKGVYI